MSGRRERSAAQALGNLAERIYRTEFYQDEEAEEGETAVQALAAWPQAIPALLELLQEKDANLRQTAATALVESGIRAIWNFAHARIDVPRGVYVRHEYISIGLAELAYRVKGVRRAR